MTVEVATYISQLDEANPDGAALAREADDHLRLLKEVLKAQFPSLGTAAVTGTAAQINSAVAIGAALTIPSPTPSREYARYVVPNGGSFVDNALSLQNLSNGGGLWGNAAIACYDAAGAERAAFGYSRNELVSPGGFLQRVLYLEGGNINADAQDTDVVVVITHGPTATNFPNTSLEAIRVHANTGDVRIRTQGAGALTAHTDTYIGDVGAPKTLAINGGTTRARVREYDIANQFAFATNISNMPAGGAITQDSPAVSSWCLSMGGGLDWLTVRRAPAGSATLTTLFSIGSGGLVSVGSLNVNGLAVTAQRSKRTTTGTITLADLRQTIAMSGNLTIPAATFAAGDYVHFVNTTGGNLTLQQGVGFGLYIGTNSNNSNATVRARGSCTLWFDTASIGYVTGDVT